MGKNGRRRPARLWKFVGLGVLVAVALGVAWLATRPTTAPAAPDAVASAYDTSKASITPRPQLPNIVFIGDSYTAGSSMDGGVHYADLIANKKGWNAFNLGEGGSGYVVKGTKGTTIPDRVTIAADSNPNLIVLAGGFNDKWDELPAAVDATLAKVRTELPGVPVVILSNFTPSTPNMVQENKRDTLAAAAAASGATFIDVTTVFKDHPEMIGSDKLHPTAEGHRFLAEFLAPLLPAPKA